MEKQILNLSLLRSRLAIAQLSPESRFPEWAADSQFYSLTRTPDELSVVCDSDKVPSDIKAQRSWRALKVQGPFEFSMTGVLASLLEPLAMAGISTFAISTFDTDYLLVRENALENAVVVLTAHGHHFDESVEDLQSID